MDKFTPEQRSEIMSRIKAKDTKPEMVVRKLVHGLGYRYRLHRRDLPGQPDLVFPSRKKVIYVHGCFWHQHEECKISHLTKSNKEYCIPKLQRTVERDATIRSKLKQMGWDYLVIWECEVRKGEGLGDKMIDFLDTF